MACAQRRGEGLGGGEAIEARSWTTFVKEENGESLARIIKLVSFELAPTMPLRGGGGGGGGGVSREKFGEERVEGYHG
jgi:hypothetical protein